MVKVTKIAIAGEGGQGVQSIAEILAEAANEEGKNALYIPNFGVEQRGGVSIAFVQVSDGQIGAPKFQKADILIPVSPRAVQRTKMYAGKDTVYIYDNSLIQEGEVKDNIVGLQYFDVTPPCPTAEQPNADLPQDMIAGEPKTGSFAKKGPAVDPEDLPEVKKVLAIPANDIAKNELHPRVFNIIILGAVIAATEVLPLDTIKEALETKLGDKFKQNPALRDMNFKALERGYQLIKGVM
ncbi:2-oxoacid:acceptor oxidoreductase family protein [Sporomusa acidovorans]|uniref:NADH-dependent phenylglyoxylate dehydrogenase subunit gamma n=1 Tax=Sporomusa acidovorans (strain ATCC 49682 / DSM 3132 / Mol) TaxID=1123286 RepID=A0ABZ3J188_SPOA4|nr:2-oxoacid:acceptor oxidoreductase family protein [Sporomusa acidovorans]OZC14459.1 pyruvate synthase subunit PorC [Sporomusa acidovorans DSM 3132]SDF49894.1 Pyruvate:ferredoxin oxidoreductase, gamma subunit [Sporomusa acidovorans]